MNRESLIVGRTYYRLTFADKDFTMPGVEPLVYLGEVTLDGEDSKYAFQDTVSYSRFGSGLSTARGNNEAIICFIAEDGLSDSLMGVEELASEVALAAQRAVELQYPVLPVLLSGWKSAS